MLILFKKQAKKPKPNSHTPTLQARKNDQLQNPIPNLPFFSAQYRCQVSSHPAIRVLLSSKTSCHLSLPSVFISQSLIGTP